MISFAFRQFTTDAGALSTCRSRQAHAALVYMGRLWIVGGVSVSGSKVRYTENHSDIEATKCAKSADMLLPCCVRIAFPPFLSLIPSLLPARCLLV